MLNIFNKYGRKKVKDKTLNYEDIQKLLYSQDVDIDCKLSSYNDFERILNSLDEEKNINLTLEYINEGFNENDIRNLNKLKPEFVLNKAHRELKPIDNEKDYFDINYKISTKRKYYKHSIEIETGERETHTRNITKKKRATLEWKVFK